MNVLFLDKDPKKAAKMMPDNYLNKMAVEAAQILSTAIRVRLGEEGELRQELMSPLGKWEQVAPYPFVLEEEKGNPEYHYVYLATHQNSPWTLWVRYSKTNFTWLVKHARALIEEFESRFEKEKGTHATIEILDHIEKLYPLLEFQYKGLTPPPIVTNGKGITSDDAVTAYRHYLHFKKCKWEKKGSKKPTWFDEDMNEKLSKPKQKNKKSS